MVENLDDIMWWGKQIYKQLMQVEFIYIIYVV